MYGPVRSHQSDLLEPLRYSSSFQFIIYSIYNTGVISKNKGATLAKSEHNYGEQKFHQMAISQI